MKIILIQLQFINLKSYFIPTHYIFIIIYNSQ